MLHSKIWVLSIIFTIYMCLTLLWARNGGDEGPLYYLRRPIYLFVFLGLTVELAERYPQFGRYLFKTVCWGAAITAVISIFLMYPDVFMRDSRLRHVAHQLNSPIEGGGVYGLTVFFTYFFLFKNRARNYEWVYVGLAGLFLLTMVLTKSRGPLIAFSVTGVLCGLITRDTKVLVTLIAIAIAVVTLSNGGNFGKRIFSLETGRFELAKRLIEESQDSLVFGRGISTDTRFTLKDGRTRPHGHNAYLGTLFKGGLVGLFLLLSVIGVGFYESFRYFLKTKNITYFALLLFGSICIISGEDKLLTHPDALWLIFWLPLGLIAGEEVKRKVALSYSSPTPSQAKPNSPLHTSRQTQNV